MNEILFIKELKDLKNTLKQQLTNYFPENSTIAIKLHMGELGNKYYLKPEYAKAVVDVCKELKLKPFLFDSPVKYTGPRHFSKGYLLVAMKHGFTKIAKVKVSNESIKVKGKHMDYEVCKELIVDGVIVLSHVKGHPCTGFGGAIKNLGMGAVTRETKGKIHSGAEPVYVGNCTQCGECQKNCPTNNIKIKNHPVFGDDCLGCSNCAVVCPNNAIKSRIANFDVLISESADAALKQFKKTYFINVLTNISEFCDCWPGSNKLIGKDIGILLGKDIIAIEKASYDLIKKEHGKDIFKEANHRDALLHIKEGEKLGMGNSGYKLEEI